MKIFYKQDRRNKNINQQEFFIKNFMIVTKKKMNNLKIRII